MAIKKIAVRNFKSFENIDVELGKLNVLIGANASGKSNFIHIFKFLKDIASHGLANAISIQGGVEYLRNINLDPSQDFSVGVVSDTPMFQPVAMQKGVLIGIKGNNISYDFALKFTKEGSGFEVAGENLTLNGDFFTFGRISSRRDIFRREKKLGKGKIVISRTNGNIKADLTKPEEVSVKESDILSTFFAAQKLPPKKLLLEGPYAFIAGELGKFFSDFSIHDFDPKLLKKATPITGKADLEEDGNNLAIVLKNILENEDKKRKLSNFVGDLLPFVSDLDVEKFADKSLLFKLRETYCKNQYVPASLLSDGTINVTAVIIALYFQEKPLVIIEEPERNIHPYLISKVINMMKDASREKQIIVTTHNPEVIKHAGLENILFVSRDKECFSHIQRLSQKEEIKRFLENEIGVEELYVQNLLEI